MRGEAKNMLYGYIGCKEWCTHVELNHKPSDP